MGVELFPEALCPFKFDVGSLVSARIVEDEPFLQMVQELPWLQFLVNFLECPFVLAVFEVIECPADLQLVAWSASYRDQKGC